MQNVLADLCVESEAATISALRLARAYDEAIAGDEQAALQAHRHRRAQVLGLQARPGRTRARRWSASAATATSRSRGCRGCIARAPLNSIWEGSGNVQCLDVLRAMVKSPAALEAFFAEVEEAEGAIRAWTPSTDAAARRVRRLPRHRAARPADRRADGAGAAGLPARPLLPRPWPTPTSPHGWTATPASPSARCRRAPTSAPSSSVTGSRPEGRREVELPSSSAPAARGWKTPPDGGVGAFQARLPRTNRVRGRAGERGRDAARGHDPRRGERGRGAAQQAALAAQYADRPLRDPDDGEPVVRPLLWVAGQRGRRDTESVLPRARRPPGADAPLQDAGHGRRRVQGLRPSRPRPRLDVGPCPAAKRLHGRGLGQRRVRPHVLQRERAPGDPSRGAQLHDV